MITKIRLTPTAPYFLGTERSAFYSDNNHIQRALVNPYYLSSARLPSQSALFGVLRYLGIASPAANFRLTEEDRRQIGNRSFNLLQVPEEDAPFGMIRRIGPLHLEDEAGNVYVPLPALLAANPLNEAGSAVYHAVETLDGTRYIPGNYKEKTADFDRWLCVTTGEIIDAPFSTHMQVGINRSESRKAGRQDRGGYFKKEYVRLKEGFSFVFYAETEDDFCFSSETDMVFLGQGKSPFAVSLSEAEKEWDGLGVLKALPESISVDGAEQTAGYGVFLSDTWFSGSYEALRKCCAFITGLPKDYRVFTTDYDKTVITAKGRYRKDENGLRLLPAGTTVLFRGSEQLDKFKAALKGAECFKHGQTAGFNTVVYTNTEGK